MVNNEYNKHYFQEFFVRVYTVRMEEELLK